MGKGFPAMAKWDDRWKPSPQIICKSGQKCNKHFHALDIKQKHATIREAFMLEELLNSSKDSRIPWLFLPRASPIPIPSSMGMEVLIALGSPWELAALLLWSKGTHSNGKSKQWPHSIILLVEVTVLWLWLKEAYSGFSLHTHKAET